MENGMSDEKLSILTKVSQDEKFSLVPSSTYDGSDSPTGGINGQSVSSDSSQNISPGNYIDGENASSTTKKSKFSFQIIMNILPCLT
jgi:hypothetical protein